MSRQGKVYARDLYPDLDGIKERKDRDKPIIAILVVGSFCIASIAALIGAFVTGRLAEGVEVLRTVAAVFGGPLGFVLGHYFARKIE